MKLTLNRIDALKCPPGKRDVVVFDDDQRGLAVRVTAAGGKYYLTQYAWLPLPGDEARYAQMHAVKAAEDDSKLKEAMIEAAAEADEQFVKPLFQFRN